MTTFQRVIGPRVLSAVAGETGWPPTSLLHWNEFVGDFLAQVPPERRRSALRGIQREVESWRRQRTAPQMAWSGWRDATPYRGPLAAMIAILGQLS